MTLDWRQLSKGDGMEVLGDVVDVSFHGGRHQRVRVEQLDGSLLVYGVIARAAAVRNLQDPALRAWERNCLSRVVGLRLDERGTTPPDHESVAGRSAHQGA